MRKVLRPILVLLALVFLVEAWLWDRLEPIVARIVSIIPAAPLKRAFVHAIEGLPPAGTLAVFLVPLALLLPFKLLGLWLLAHGDWGQAIAALIFAKLVAIGTTAFVFDVARDKLLQLDWFRVFYDYVNWLRVWAHALVAPVKQRIKFRSRMLAPHRAARALRLLIRIRRRMHMPQLAK